MQYLDASKVQEETFNSMKVIKDQEDIQEEKDLDGLINNTVERIKEASSEGDFSVCIECTKKQSKILVKYLEGSKFYTITYKYFFCSGVDVYISWKPKDINKIKKENKISRWLRNNNPFSVPNFMCTVLVFAAALCCLMIIAGIMPVIIGH